ncbi:hypothetical protein CQW23_28150 [Capsicum baccatum]|uniref:Uncharacterized protein n=1 Tax=Capsicum baccatum TaxID=33114 RepID=A0A2G2VFR3_CAPBA|nr:hypothetical protein CQW23_28150 [Capsicum baccatum]
MVMEEGKRDEREKEERGEKEEEKGRDFKESEIEGWNEGRRERWEREEGERREIEREGEGFKIHPHSVWGFAKLKQKKGVPANHQIMGFTPDFNPEMHRTRYASLLWNYGVNKVSNGYISDNQNPLRSKHAFIPSEDTKMIDVEP